MLMPSRHPLQLQNLRLRRGLEIAVFVENVVGRQQRLMEGRPHRAVPQQHRAVEQRPSDVARIGGGHSHQQRRPVLQLRRDARQRLAAARCTKPRLISRSRGRYPISASSGVTTRSAAWDCAVRRPADNQRRVPAKIARRSD